MVEEWQLVRLGDVATTSQGGTPRKNEADYWNGQIPFLTGADLTEFRLSRKHARSFLTTEGLHSGQTVVCEPGVLLLATRTRVGLAGLTTETMGASQDITRLTPSDEVHSGYLCRYLLREAASLQRKSRGTTIQGITKDELQSIAILLPPLPEQRAIATILDSIDQAIEATDALVSATKQLRDSLLHNLLTRGLPGRHTEWKQVPGLGTIPTDWQTARLGSYCERITKGTTPTTLGRPYTLSGVRFLRVENISNSGSISGGKPRFIDGDTHNLLSRSVLKDNDLVLSIAGALGRSALITKDILPANVNQALAIVRLGDRSSLLPAFLSQVLRGQSIQTQVNDMRTELAQANISLQQVADLLVPLVPLPDQQAIVAVLESVDEAIEKGREAAERSRKLKESASDALLTGRVRVKV